MLGEVSTYQHLHHPPSVPRSPPPGVWPVEPRRSCCSTSLPDPSPHRCDSSLFPFPTGPGPGPGFFSVSLCFSGKGQTGDLLGFTGHCVHCSYSALLLGRESRPKPRVGVCSQLCPRKPDLHGRAVSWVWPPGRRDRTWAHKRHSSDREGSWSPLWTATSQTPALADEVPGLGAR